MKSTDDAVDPNFKKTLLDEEVSRSSSRFARQDTDILKWQLVHHNPILESKIS